MTNQQLQGQPQIQAPMVGTGKQTNPYWFRENSTSTLGVTPQPSTSNPGLGIENISLKPASAEQRKWGILMQGNLKSIVGDIAFQIRLSHAGYPFLQTVSTEMGVDSNNEKTYFDHIRLKTPVKAQIMRLFEALQMGTPLQPAYQAPMNYGQPQAFNPALQGFAPQPQANYGQPMNYGQPQNFVQQPAPQQFPDYSAMYQGMVGQNNVGVSTPVGAEGSQGHLPPNPALEEDDLPV